MIRGSRSYTDERRVFFSGPRGEFSPVGPYMHATPSARSATALQVRKAYLRLALKYHPDKLHAKPPP